MNELAAGMIISASIIGMFFFGVYLGRKIQDIINGSNQDYWIEQYSKLAKENMELKLKLKYYDRN